MHINMPLISSPIAYPPSSSPAPIPESRKRPSLEGPSSKPKRRLFDKSFTTLAATEHILPQLKPESNRTSSKKSDLTKLYEQPSTREASLEDKGHESSNSIFSLQLDTEAADEIWSSKPTINTPLTDYDKAGRDLKRSLDIRTCSGKRLTVKEKSSQNRVAYEREIASRSIIAAGKAEKSYYGVDIHKLLDEAATLSKQKNSEAAANIPDKPRPSIETFSGPKHGKRGRTMLWTEKYRAKRFTDLVGDERTHRDVLRWLKGWDPIVFPGSAKSRIQKHNNDNPTEERQHRKILLLTGAPGLGKTTLAHVCARQAGYEVMEINASDDRSSHVVRGRIKDSVGTENVKGINSKGSDGTIRKAGRPVCVIVDEVDGVVGGSGGGGEGGFIKALIDLIALDQKNTSVLGSTSGNASGGKRSRKGDRFRLLRPIILICNDLYHPSLRPLRSVSVAEVIHIRRPTLEKVVTRLRNVFDHEGVPCDNDGVRRLCEATWGISNRRESRTQSSTSNEGDMRGVLVVGEWVAAKLRATTNEPARLTRKWVELNVLEGLSNEGGAARGLGRGGAKDVVERVFLDGAGFPIDASHQHKLALSEGVGDAQGVSELKKRAAMDRLRRIVETSDECDRVMTDCFTTYPQRSFQDDTLLSKPNAAYDWLHFHDSLSSKVYSGQEWELAPYLSHPVLGLHSLFASPARTNWGGDHSRWDEEKDEEPLPFTGPRADYLASEAKKQNRAILSRLQSTLSIPLMRSFKSAEDISTELIPQIVRMLTPNVKPVIVGGSSERGVVSVRKESEREMIQRAVGVMSAVGVTFEKGRIEGGIGASINFVYRMEPYVAFLSPFPCITDS